MDEHSTIGVAASSVEGSGTRHQNLWSSAVPGMPPSRGTAHVFAFELQTDAERMEALYQTLSRMEVERANRFHFARDRNRFITGHGVLRQILAGYLGVNPAAVEFETGHRGKPSLSKRCNWLGLHFNLAHSRELGLMAVTLDGPLGVDVEEVRDIPEAAELVARFFSAREQLEFQRLSADAKPLAFFNLWTRKEAWLKATGEGISELLHLVEVSFLPGAPVELMKVPARFSGMGQWRLEALEPCGGFVGALALPVSVSHCVYRWRQVL